MIQAAESAFPTMQTPSVLVIGGAGYFGSMLVAELLENTPAHLFIGGRNRKRVEEFCRAAPMRLTPLEVDLHRSESVDAALANVKLAICAAGPFQGLPTTLVELCLQRGVDYIDLSDDRAYVSRVRELAGAAGACPVAVCSGWSAVPALSGLLARIAVESLSSVDSLYIQIAPGNRFPRSVGTVSSLLSCVGRPFALWENRQWRTVSGWSEPRDFDFPDPVGRRRGYLVDVPDHEIFPALFAAGRVEFSVGSDIGFLNHAM